MRAIDYVAPTSLSEAVAIMATHGDRAQPLAGGTDVLVQLRGGRREAGRGGRHQENSGTERNQTGR